MPENLTYRASTDASKKGGGVELTAEELRKLKNLRDTETLWTLKV